MTDLLHNPHAGEILKLEFIDELGISQNAVARGINVPPNRIHAIVKGQRSITADTDLRLCKFFGLSEGFFLRLQMAFETTKAKREAADEIRHISPYSGLLASAPDVIPEVNAKH